MGLGQMIPTSQLKTSKKIKYREYGRSNSEPATNRLWYTTRLDVLITQRVKNRDQSGDKVTGTGHRSKIYAL